MLPIRVQLNQDWGRMVTLAMETAGSWGGIGHVIGHEATNRSLLEQHDPAIEQALGVPLPAETLPWRDYRGHPRMIVLTPRGDRAKAEALTLTVMILDHGQPQAAVLRWRTLGAGPWHEVPLRHIARAVHTVTLPAAGDDRPPLFNPNLRTQSVLLFLRQLVRPDNQRFQLRKHVQIPN